MVDHNGLNRAERMALRVMPWSTFLAVVVVTGLAMLVSQTNGQVEDLQDQTSRLESFVEEFQEDQETTGLNNEAINRAVAMVPELRDILCEEFPHTDACRG